MGPVRLLKVGWPLHPEFRSSPAQAHTATWSCTRTGPHPQGSWDEVGAVCALVLGPLALDEDRPAQVKRDS